MGFEEEELRSPKTSPERLRELAAALPAQVAVHKQAPPDVLAALSTHPDEDVRWQVARRRQTPPSALTAMTADPAARVRLAAYENEQLPEEARASAITDPDPEVRASVAGGSNDEVALATLAADPSPTVRAALAANPACPEELLTTLAADPHEAVRVAVAAADDTSVALLESLANDGSSAVLAEVAGREIAPAILDRLARHPDGAVREAAAGNAETPVATLAAMTRDASEAVRHALVWHSAANDAMRDVLARDPAEKIREAVARTAKAPLEALALLVRDPAPRVRSLAASDPRLQEPQLLALASDTDDLVRAAARKNPSATPAVRAAVEAEDARVKRYVDERPASDLRYVELTVGAEHVAGSRSTVAGPTWLPKGEPWPTCRRCGEPLALFVAVRFDGVPSWIRPGSQLSVFACRTHDDIPSFATVEQDQPLPRDAWAQTEGHAHLRLDPPEAALEERTAPLGALRAATLALAPKPEEVAEAGPLRARFFVGSRGFKLGGVPHWVQDRETYRCFCGSRMSLALQVPEDQDFPVDGTDRRAVLFLGNQLYVLACEAQCDPLAVWPIVQN